MKFGVAKFFSSNANGSVQIAHDMNLACAENSYFDNGNAT